MCRGKEVGKSMTFRILQCGCNKEFAVRNHGRKCAETQGRGLSGREPLMTSAAREFC